jgi:hypothetical protein
VEVVREKYKTAQSDAIEALCTAEDAKDDVVELRARDEEKPALALHPNRFHAIPGRSNSTRRRSEGLLSPAHMYVELSSRQS